MTVFDTIFVAFASVVGGLFLSLYWLVGRWRKQVLPVRHALFDVMQYMPMLAAIQASTHYAVVIVGLTVVLGMTLAYTAFAWLGVVPVRWLGAVWAISLAGAAADLIYRSFRYDLAYQAMFGAFCGMWAIVLASYSYFGMRLHSLLSFGVLSFVLLSMTFGVWVAAKGRDRYADVLKDI